MNPVTLQQKNALVKSQKQVPGTSIIFTRNMKVIQYTSLIFLLEVQR